MADREPSRGEQPGVPVIGDFEGEPTRRLADWQWLWSTDAAFPVRSHRGLLGKAVVLFKRLLRPLVRAPQNDLWQRQRVFNLILLEHLQSHDDRAQRLEQQLAQLEQRLSHGLDLVMQHNDALFSRVDLKMDRYRRSSVEHSAALRAALASQPTSDSSQTTAAQDPASQRLLEADQAHRYIDFENRYRGTGREIAQRIAHYLPRLKGLTPILDIGCGRGEALQVFRDHQLEARGVDSSVEMVRHCREQGLTVEHLDAQAALAACPPDSVGSVVSFHVVEHLSAIQVDQLIDLAWRALRPGGMLLVETPNPLSLVSGASRFWIDPSHLRPVHPEALRFRCESAGFRSVEMATLHPFADQDRLPEINPDRSAEGGENPDSDPLSALTDGVERLRDRLDDLLFGDQDFVVIATK